MKATEQGTDSQPATSGGRYCVIPRTLVFVTKMDAQTGVEQVLLLRGAPDKRLWPNLYNGLGGHVEKGEDVLTAARREVREEAGLDIHDVLLRGIINIDAGSNEHSVQPGVIVFVYRATCASGELVVSEEGAPEWISLNRLMDYSLVDDLYEVIPRVLSDGPLFYGSYIPRSDGTLLYQFHDADEQA